MCYLDKKESRRVKKEADLEKKTSACILWEPVYGRFTYKQTLYRMPSDMMMSWGGKLRQVEAPVPGEQLDIKYRYFQVAKQFSPIIAPSAKLVIRNAWC